MKKIYSILSIVAVVASTLFVSCAQKKTPDVVTAPPMYVEATYTALDDGGHDWIWDAAYTYNSSHVYRGLYQRTVNDTGGYEVDKNEWIRYEMMPNVDWTATIVEGSEYLQFLVNPNGYIGPNPDGNYLTNTVSGKRGNNTLVFCVVKTPAYGEENVTCKVDIEMANESINICTFVIEASLVPTSGSN
ncbi:MAG: hypothetical protein IKA04_11680 [Alistipes sp.]|nr:hypothetical protein [Alistipes sp.]